VRRPPLDLLVPRQVDGLRPARGEAVVIGRRDAEALELGRVVAAARSAGVRQEQHALAIHPELRDRLGRARQRLVAHLHDASRSGKNASDRSASLTLGAGR
jgi:hypothetical protein